MVRYSEDHEWVRLEGDTVTLGISEHAQSELGDITFVELPQVGDSVAKGEAFCVVESVKAASDIFSPVNGTIASVNEALEDSPETVNNDAEGDGWICTIAGVSESDLAGLMTKEEYDSFCKN